MASDEEFVGELKRQGVPKGYSRYAVDYLESAGIDPRTVDVAAEYDSTLTDTGNTKEFARKFPVGRTKRYTKGEVEYTEDRAQEYAEKAYFEEKRKKREQGFDEGDMPAEPQSKPSFIDSIVGRYNEMKAGYQTRAEAQKKERVFRATEKSRQLESELQVKRAEARVRRMENEKRYYDRAESRARFAPLVAIRDSIRGFGNRFAGRTVGNERRQACAQGTAQRLIFGNGGGGSMGGRFGSGGGSQAMRMLMGQPMQQERSLIGRLAGGDRNRPNKLASMLFGGR